MNSQVNQNAIRKVSKAWKAYFKSIKDYHCNPQKYKIKPKMPGYIRTEQTTAWFTGQVAKLVVKGGTIPDISGSVKVPDVVIPDTNNKDTDKKDDKEDGKKDEKKDEATYEKFNAWVKSFMNYDKFCMPIGR